MSRSYYFGLWSGTTSGHFLYDKEGSRSHRVSALEKVPFSLAELDSGFCPKSTQRQGVAKLSWEKNWTILAFWDQTGDSRPGSHSTFLVKGPHKFEAALAQKRAAFPSIWTRIDAAFPIQPMCCSICREPSGYEIEDIYDFVCDGCA